jgi:hypothetical protein
MPNYWKTRLSNFYRIFTKVVAIFLLFLFFYNLSFLPFKKSAQVVYYQEYIKGEKDIGQDAGRIKQGAQNLAEIEKIESSILTEAKKKLQKQGQDLKENKTLIEAKERLKKAEEKHKERKLELEKKAKEKENISPKAEKDYSLEEKKVIEDYGQAFVWEDDANKYRQAELAKVSQEVIQNIQNELNRAELSITDLDIELSKAEKWEKRLWYTSAILDPIRFFLIQPCQAISKWSGIVNWNLFWDLFLKVLLMRLLLNWISYPPRLDLNLAKPRERSEPTDLASLEEEKKLMMQQWEWMKQMFFNICMSVLLINFFSFHPYVIDRTKTFFGKSDKMIYWLAFYLVVSLLSQFATMMLYQKISFGNYLKNYWWLSIFLVFICAFYYTRGFGDYLIALMSEVANIFLSLIKKFFQSKKQIIKKEKPQWKRKWNYKNYKH